MYYYFRLFGGKVLDFLDFYLAPVIGLDDAVDEDRHVFPVWDFLYDKGLFVQFFNRHPDFHNASAAAFVVS